MINFYAGFVIACNRMILPCWIGLVQYLDGLSSVIASDFEIEYEVFRALCIVGFGTMVLYIRNLGCWCTVHTDGTYIT